MFTHRWAIQLYYKGSRMLKPSENTSNIQWRKSSSSSSHGGNCVETTCACGLVLIRDSKNPTGPELFARMDSWRKFLAATMDGHLGVQDEP